MPDPSLDGFVRCLRCGRSQWRAAADGVECSGCAARLPRDGGVYRMPGGPPDAVAEHYAVTGGPHFVGASFADNMQIHFSTHAYRRHLEELLPRPQGALVDLGCGDGRLSLWALEAGFRPVVAMDSSLAPLQRLGAVVKERGLDGLVPVQASFDDECLVAGAFAAALAIEAFTYLGDDYGRGLSLLRRVLRPDGRGVVSEFGRAGRLLSDVIAVNLENMAAIAAGGRRWEKFADRRLSQRLFTIEELERACEAAGLAVRERRGISPVPMLFQYAHTFTSYPLRPPLDVALERLLGELDAQTDAPSDFSRNIVVLVAAKG